MGDQLFDVQGPTDQTGDGRGYGNPKTIYSTLED